LGAVQEALSALAEGGGGAAAPAVAPTWPVPDAAAAGALQEAMPGYEGTVSPVLDPAVRFRPLARFDGAAGVVLVFVVDLDGKAWAMRMVGDEALLAPADPSGSSELQWWLAPALLRAMPVLRASETLVEVAELKVAVVLRNGRVTGIEAGWVDDGVVWVGTMPEGAPDGVEGLPAFGAAVFDRPAG
jgi:hypothetical protein